MRRPGCTNPLVALTTRERAFKGRLLDQAEIKPSERVLDLGCGTGTLAISAKERAPAAEITGLDGDPEILDRARRKAQAGGVEISFDQGFSDQLPYDSGVFDCVVSSPFIHRSAGPRERSVSNVLRLARAVRGVAATPWGSHGLARWIHDFPPSVECLTVPSASAA